MGDGMSLHSSDIEIDTDDQEETDDVEENKTRAPGSEKSSVRRENVIRCKLYRDKKKNELLEGEKELAKLSEENNSLKIREILDKSITALHKKYLQIVESGYVCNNDCDDDDDDDSDGEEENPGEPNIGTQ